MDFARRCYRGVGYPRAVLSTVVAAVGTAALVAWVAGVSGAFGPTTNWTLFASGLALLVVSRAFALRESRQ
jgi:hypothetical protein